MGRRLFHVKKYFIFLDDQAKRNIIIQFPRPVNKRRRKKPSPRGHLFSFIFPVKQQVSSNNLAELVSKPGRYYRQHNAKGAETKGGSHPATAPPERGQSNDATKYCQTAEHKQYPNGDGDKSEQHFRHSFLPPVQIKLIYEFDQPGLSYFNTCNQIANIISFEYDFLSTLNRISLHSSSVC